ncbi:MAG: hypothetical protein JNM80_13765 [Phycisphaerae bacterium]|nr:hypothetical protein [Phycisphaerae bacterium]
MTTSASYALPTDELYTQVAAGNGFSLGLREDGTIKASGASSNPAVANAPTSAGWVAVAAGYNHALALQSDGALAAWGSNDFGQGVVPTDPYEYDLVYIAIAAGEYFNLALRSDGTIFAWGDDDYHKTTVPNNSIGRYTAIAAGGHHAVAKRSDGKMAAWGGEGYCSNYCGPSIPTHYPQQPSSQTWTHPGQVPTTLVASQILAVGAGHTVSYAILNDSARTLVAWGCGLGLQGTPVTGKGYYVVGATNGASVTGCYGAGIMLTLDAHLVQWGRLNGTGTAFSDPPNNIPSALEDTKFVSVGRGNSNLHGVALLAP